ncbi:hypothetical protein UVI_02020210 [Ustilaginoidea virens]|uniref:RABX5 catalytic core helical domain-containing protein n=1 Tax=Ustilaginoidea virens TaxID=1159556 RepID=A0A1B5L3M1_USTVR|nr:hypothetical protein UVI_02020210 [Ustilaginoidea virens]
MSPSEEPTAHGVSDTTQSSNNHARSTSTSQPASSTPQTGPVYEQDDEQEQHAPDPRGKTRASALIDSAEAPTTEGPVSRANPMPQAATEAYAVTVAVAVAPPEPSNDKPVLAPCHLADSEAADAMASSVTTIKAPTPTSHHEHAAHHLAAVQPSYVDPTPATPMISQPPSRSPSSAARSHRSGDPSPSRSDVEEDKSYASEDEQDGGSRSEIQSIMEQFSEEGGGPGADEVMSPRLEIASPMFAAPVQHPPRKSSLEPSSQSLSKQVSEFSSLRVATSSPSSERGDRSNERGLQDQGPPVPPKDSVFANRPRSTEDGHPPSVTSLPSPQLAKHRPPPPEPEPEPSLPFDFHRFLEQLRNKKADPVARYLKSFLSEFGKKQWMVHEQVKIIGDFLAFIANKMVLCDVWKDVSDAEFDNAREGMEKLVMNRLYAQTFSPAIPCPKPIPGAKPKRRGADASLGPGRRGQHQEDVERDEILTQKINIYGWVKLEHLDVPAVGDSGRRFLKLAQQGNPCRALPRSAAVKQKTLVWVAREMMGD